jgi:hypothetical protein
VQEGNFNRKRSSAQGDVLPRGGIITLSKLEQMPILDYCKGGDTSKKTFDKRHESNALRPLGLPKETFMQEVENY